MDQLHACIDPSCHHATEWPFVGATRYGFNILTWIWSETWCKGLLKDCCNWIIKWLHHLHFITTEVHRTGRKLPTNQTWTSPGQFRPPALFSQTRRVSAPHSKINPFWGPYSASRHFQTISTRCLMYVEYPWRLQFMISTRALNCKKTKKGIDSIPCTMCDKEAKEEVECSLFTWERICFST